jgi:hypothetical protein
MFVPPKKGVGNARCSMHPQPHVPNWVVSTRASSPRGSPDSPGIPARNGFNGFLRALLGDRAFLSPSPAECFPADLTPASRRQDHTTSPSAKSAHRQARSRVHHIPSRVRDDRDTPLEWDETARLVEVIWVEREQKCFRSRDWTCGIRLIRFEKSRF